MQFRSKYEAPWADRERVVIVKTVEGRIYRPVTKAEKCCQCGWCCLFCPVGCVTDRGTHFAANLDYCKGCGICAQECPVDAIVMVREGG